MRISDWSSDVCSSDLFILQLAERQRIESDAGAIMAIGAEALGRRLGADRAGFLRIVDGDQIAFGIGWSDGSIPPLEGRAPLDVIGSDLRRGAIAGAAHKFPDWMGRESWWARVWKYV